MTMASWRDPNVVYLKKTSVSFLSLSFLIVWKICNLVYLSWDVAEWLTYRALAILLRKNCSDDFSCFCVNLSPSPRNLVISKRYHERHSFCNFCNFCNFSIVRYFYWVRSNKLAFATNVSLALREKKAIYIRCIQLNMLL